MISDPKLPFAGDPAIIGTSTERRNEATPGSAAASNHVAAPVRVSLAHLWLRRVGVLLFVFLCATLGVMLMILPWRPEWSENRLLLGYPAIRDMVASGFVRGVVTGLGVLNVWLGFWEAIQYRED